jgi:hypothetical protein
MAAILRFIKKADLGSVFDEDTTTLMGAAFDASCKELHDTGQPGIVYEVMANRIIEAARSGERNPEKLRQAALAGLERKRS